MTAIDFGQMQKLFILLLCILLVFPVPVRAQQCSVVFSKPTEQILAARIQRICELACDKSELIRTIYETLSEHTFLRRAKNLAILLSIFSGTGAFVAVSTGGTTWSTYIAAFLAVISASLSLPLLGKPVQWVAQWSGVDHSNLKDTIAERLEGLYWRMNQRFSQSAQIGRGTLQASNVAAQSRARAARQEIKWDDERAAAIQIADLLLYTRVVFADVDPKSPEFVGTVRAAFFGLQDLSPRFIDEVRAWLEREDPDFAIYRDHYRSVLAAWMRNAELEF